MPDIVTLAMAKAYSDSKGGYTEKKTVTVNPDGEFVDLLGDGTWLQRVSEPVDLNTLSSLRVISGLGEVLEIAGELLSIKTEDIGAQQCCDGDYGLLLNLPTEMQGIPAGLYAVRLVLSATFEIVHPISPKYLPEEVTTNVVDLTKYKIECEDNNILNGQTFNLALALTISESATAGGAVKTLEVTDVDGALHDALNTDKDTIVTMSTDVTVTKCPVNIVLNKENDEVVSVSANAIVLLSGTQFEVKIYILFGYQTATIMVKATPFA